MDNHCMAPRWIGIQRPGGYADHLLIPHPKYLVDASGIDPMWAATLSCSGLTTYSAVSQLKPIPRDEWVMLLGAGGLGLMAIEMLKALRSPAGLCTARWIWSARRTPRAWRWERCARAES
jgi:D-arabinose 1-dehydrogenase-like Zn-dependent alcohol dehydrogenase